MIFQLRAEKLKKNNYGRKVQEEHMLWNLEQFLLSSSNFSNKQQKKITSSREKKKNTSSVLYIRVYVDFSTCLFLVVCFVRDEYMMSPCICEEVPRVMRDTHPIFRLCSSLRERGSMLACGTYLTFLAQTTDDHQTFSLVPHLPR